MLITLQEGTLSSISSWALSVLGVLAGYKETGHGNDDLSLPSLSLDVCQFVLKEIHHKTVCTHKYCDYTRLHVHVIVIIIISINY